MKLTSLLVVLDLETTGTWIEKDKIIEIAMVKCFPDGRRETYDKRVRPGIRIPPIVTKLTGISDEDVKDAPLFREIAGEVLAFIGQADLAGFNAERFDLPLLEREMFEAGEKFNWQSHKIYDAQKVYHLNEKRDLTAAYKFYCGKELVNAHSALADTEATLEILASQVGKYAGEGEGIEALGGFSYRQLEDFYDAQRRFRWWNGELYPTFGKYAKRQSLRQIALKDPRYLEWVLNADFSETVKDVVQDALKGQFPKYKEPEEHS